MNEETGKRDGSTANEDVRHVIKFLKRLFEKRKFIAIITGAFLILGVFVAIFTPKEYTVSSMIVPQVSVKKSVMAFSSFQSLMDGFGNDDLAISPLVYPGILGNVDYQKELMHSKVLTFKNVDHPISLYEWFTIPGMRKPSVLGIVKKYTIGLPSMIVGAVFNDNKIEQAADSIRSGGLNILTKKEYAVAKSIGSCIKLSVNYKTGMITLVGTMPEAVPAAQIAQLAYDLLQKYITLLKSQKAMDEYNYVLQQRDEAREVFLEKQIALAKYQDANRIISTATARTREQQLRAEYNLANTIYTQLENRLVVAQLKVREDTPMLTQIQPIVVPNKASKPQCLKLLAIYTLLGLILGCALVWGFDWLYSQNIKWPKRWDPATCSADKVNT